MPKKIHYKILYSRPYTDTINHGYHRWTLDKVVWLFEPRDCWIGLYFKPHGTGLLKFMDVFLTIIPMLPIRFDFIKEA